MGNILGFTHPPLPSRKEKLSTLSFSFLFPSFLYFSYPFPYSYRQKKRNGKKRSKRTEPKEPASCCNSYKIRGIKDDSQKITKPYFTAENENRDNEDNYCQPVLQFIFQKLYSFSYLLFDFFFHFHFFSLLSEKSMKEKRKENLFIPGEKGGTPPAMTEPTGHERNMLQKIKHATTPGGRAASKAYFLTALSIILGKCEQILLIL